MYSRRSDNIKQIKLSCFNLEFVAFHKDQFEVEDDTSTNQDENSTRVFLFEPEGVHAYIQVHKPF